MSLSINPYAISDERMQEIQEELNQNWKSEMDDPFGGKYDQEEKAKLEKGELNRQHIEKVRTRQRIEIRDHMESRMQDSGSVFSNIFTFSDFLPLIRESKAELSFWGKRCVSVQGELLPINALATHMMKLFLLSYCSYEGQDVKILSDFLDNNQIRIGKKIVEHINKIYSDSDSDPKLTSRKYYLIHLVGSVFIRCVDWVKKTFKHWNHIEILASTTLSEIFSIRCSRCMDIRERWLGVNKVFADDSIGNLSDGLSDCSLAFLPWHLRMDLMDVKSDRMDPRLRML